jgi:hypothetical protein
MSSGWFDCTEPSLISIQEQRGVMTGEERCNALEKVRYSRTALNSFWRTLYTLRQTLILSSATALQRTVFRRIMFTPVHMHNNTLPAWAKIYHLHDSWLAIMYSQGEQKKNRNKYRNKGCILFWPAIPTSPFNFIQLFLYLLQESNHILLCMWRPFPCMLYWTGLMLLRFDKHLLNSTNWNIIFPPG